MTVSSIEGVPPDPAPTMTDYSNIQFRFLTRDSLPALTTREDAVKSNLASLTADRRLAAGAVLPSKCCAQLAPEMIGTPLEEIDVFYKHLNIPTFVVVTTDKLIMRFSASSSLWLLSPFNPIRKFALGVIVNLWFIRVMTAVLLTHLVIMTMPANPTTESFIFYFYVVYILELFVKVIALGFVLTPFSYLRNPWNCLDLAAISSFVLGMFFVIEPIGLIEIRMFRILLIFKTGTVYPDDDKQDAAAAPETAVAVKEISEGWVSRHYQQRLQAIASHPFFDLFIMTCIMATIVVSMVPLEDNSFSGLSYILAGIFLVEIVLKLIGFGPIAYFKDEWNRFDCIVLAMTIYWYIGLGIPFGSMDIAVRIWKLAKWWPTLNLLGVNFGRGQHAQLALFMVIFAVLGMRFFDRSYVEHVDWFPNEELPRWNFTDFIHSFMAVFRILCGDWISMMLDCQVVSNCCVCAAYFIGTFVTGNLLILNLFLGLVLSSANVPMTFANNNIVEAFRLIKSRKKPNELTSSPTNEPADIQERIHLNVAENGASVDKDLVESDSVLKTETIVNFESGNAVTTVSSVDQTVTDIVSVTYHPIKLTLKEKKFDRVVVNAVCLVPLFEVLLVFLLFWTILAILGMSVFGGKFHQCIVIPVGDAGVYSSLKTAEVAPLHEVMNAEECHYKNYSWVNSKYNFDNIFNAYISLYQVATLSDGWTDITNSAVDNRGFREQPAREVNVYMYFYFVGVVLCHFHLLSLVVCVVVNNFYQLRDGFKAILSTK